MRRKDKRDPMTKRPSAATRTGCRAHIKIQWTDYGKYEVCRFEEGHNHPLVGRQMIHLLRSHRHISEPQAAEVDIADSASLTLKETVDLMAAKHGGIENLGFARVDLRNHMHDKNKISMSKGDVRGLMQFFGRKQFDDPSFRYDIQLDDEKLITNIFWIDGGMILDYLHFSDIICFDTKYKTNIENRPLTFFVGVNHHKQSIIFGVALLYDESVESFSWLFRTFLKAMNGKEPQIILTNEDPAMANAIKLALPRTYHKNCVWHLYQNATKHLSHEFSSNKELVVDFKRCVYDCHDSEEFEEAWETMLSKYNLVSNDWLKRKYIDQEEWSLAYGRNTFSADMSSTQRSEVMHNMIKKHLNKQKCMAHLLVHINEVLQNHRYSELEADCIMMHSVERPNANSTIHKYAKAIFTPKIYDEIHEALNEIRECVIQSSCET